MSFYVAPDYYPTFECKCGSCRSTCCRGWGITISMSEYFKLVGLPCGKNLRKRLDGAFHIAENPRPERYAVIAPNWEGDCHLRAQDGLCLLHKEKGENALPAICRLYPRRIAGGMCALSGSCEGVIEMLLARQEKITFVDYMDARATEPPHKLHNRGEELYAKELRMLSIHVLQDRRYPIAARMMRLGRIMEELYTYVRGRDPEGMGAAIQNFEENPDHFVALTAFRTEVTEATLKVAEVFSRNSESLAPYWEAGVQNLARADYREMRRAFEQKYPEWERHFEQITINHMIFTGFPYTDVHDDLLAEYAGLCAAHCVILYLATIYTFDREGLAPLADVVAAAFRMIEHSDFERRAHIVFERLGLRTQAHMDELLCAL